MRIIIESDEKPSLSSPQPSLPERSAGSGTDIDAGSPAIALVQAIGAQAPASELRIAAGGPPRELLEALEQAATPAAVIESGAVNAGPAPS